MKLDSCLTTIDKVPHCAARAFIYGSYRPMPTSLIQCFQSAFTIHNETVNVWTHLVPFLWMVYEFSMVAEKHPVELISFPLYIYAFSFMLVMLVSSVAHLFNAHSVHTYQCCFTMDYAAVLFYGVAFQNAAEHYLFPLHCFVPKGYSSDTHRLLMTLYCTLQMLTGCLPFIPGFSTFFRDASYFIGFVIINVPGFLRYFVLGTANESSECWPLGKALYNLYAAHCLCVLLGVIIFASRFPERLIPGKFDIIGCSHNLFHVFSASALYIDFIMIERTLSEAKSLAQSGLIKESDLGISFKQTVGFPFTVLFVVHIIVVGFNLLTIVNKKYKQL